MAPTNSSTGRCHCPPAYIDISCWMPTQHITAAQLTCVTSYSQYNFVTLATSICGWIVVYDVRFISTISLQKPSDIPLRINISHTISHFVISVLLVPSSCATCSYFLILSLTVVDHFGFISSLSRSDWWDRFSSFLETNKADIMTN